jgi:hypothetical protein
MGGENMGGGGERGDEREKRLAEWLVVTVVADVVIVLLREEGERGASSADATSERQRRMRVCFEEEMCDLGTGALAERVRPVIGSIVNEDQVHCVQDKIGKRGLKVELGERR